jgi:hypothetical protein
MPVDDFTSCKTKDDANYNYFACQFFESLTRYQTTDPKGYWLGRLLAFGFSLDNLLGENFTEDTFREDLENADIIFHGYTLIDVIYTPQQDFVEVVGKVELDVTFNSRRQTFVTDFTHNIKQGWLSAETFFSSNNT